MNLRRRLPPEGPDRRCGRTWRVDRTMGDRNEIDPALAERDLLAGRPRLTPAPTLRRGRGRADARRRRVDPRDGER